MAKLPLNLFEAFHGRPRPPYTYKTFRVPRKLISLGRAVAIVYESDKLAGGGDGKKAQYLHEFETDVELFMDEHGEKQLYLLGNFVKITEKGIEN